MRLQAKKQLGQNFLTNKSTQQRVANAMEAFAKEYPTKPLVEIGPGQGDITEHIIGWGRGLVCVEIDQDAVSLLEQKFVDQNEFKLIHSDALEILSKPELSKVLPPDFLLLSSLPYNVGSRILVELAIQFPTTPFAVILQAEVIDKMKVNSRLTFFGAWLNLFWDIKKVFDIAPGNFTPVPKVISSIVTATPRIEVIDQLSTPEKRSSAKSVLKAFFAMPSKTIENNLKKLGLDSAKIQEVLVTAGVETGQRFSWKNYESLLLAVLNLPKS